MGDTSYQTEVKVGNVGENGMVADRCALLRALPLGLTLAVLAIISLLSLFLSNVVILVRHASEVQAEAVLIRVYTLLFTLLLLAVEIRPLRRRLSNRVQFFAVLTPWITRGFILVFVGLIGASPLGFSTESIGDVNCFIDTEDGGMLFGRWITGLLTVGVAVAYFVLGVLGFQKYDEPSTEQPAGEQQHLVK
eukprot:TRINITY_DN13932_c0_g2_i1.p1 TRINITY_DN13932_c0_g2~~TRINITY_DN13932_c0_g2_i1.p1  ORF type:complete len:199 (-),score=37.06 TRINITY_DN13932_c0_g2_i1:238-813(-)